MFVELLQAVQASKQQLPEIFDGIPFYRWPRRICKVGNLLESELELTLPGEKCGKKSEKRASLTDNEKSRETEKEKNFWQYFKKSFD